MLESFEMSLNTNLAIRRSSFLSPMTRTRTLDTLREGMCTSNANGCPISSSVSPVCHTGGEIRVVCANANEVWNRCAPDAKLLGRGHRNREIHVRT
jgi:hypothetical protein